ncbi:MAG: glycosyltransferase, partial [Patescibacteria group bacterium]
LKNPNYRLIICGSGKLMELVRSAAAKDARIKYIGQVNREEVLVYQRKSTLLINPRQPNNGLTRYTFPSKTMEYMASGTPLLMYELEGIAKEYFNYCYTLDDLSPEALKNTLVNILSKSNEELSIKGRLAREFIINQKSSKVQVKKILDLINQ